MGIRTALWEKWIDFKYSWGRITASAVISPLLYLIAFGFGLGSYADVDARPYIEFLVPGIIALSSMNTGYSSVAMTLNTQRLYEHSFDQIMISPTPLWQYIIGQAIGGALRGLYISVIVLILSFIFGVTLHLNVMFFAVIIINGMVFSSLGVLAAIIAKTHIVITDGRGNVSLDGEKKPVDEMLEMSEKIQGIKQIDSMVIDIEKSGIMSFGIAKRLADALGGKYFKLDELRSDDIINIVRASGKSEAS